MEVCQPRLNETTTATTSTGNEPLLIKCYSIMVGPHTNTMKKEALIKRRKTNLILEKIFHTPFSLSNFYFLSKRDAKF